MYMDTYVSTIGVDFREKTTLIDNKRIKFTIFDTAGEEKNRP